MMKLVSWLAAVLLLVAFEQQALADGGRQLLKDICKDDNKRIDSVEGIAQLKLAVEIEQQDDDELMLCADKYRTYVQELYEIVSDEENSVCSHAAVSRISSFHWRYVIGQLDKKWAKHLGSELPKPLLAFFIDYANRVSKECAKNLYWNLIEASRNPGLMAEQMKGGTLGRLMDVAKFVLTKEENIKNVDSFLLLWHTSLDKLKRQGELDVETYKLENDDALVGFKVKEPEKIWEVQDVCRYQVRPIYQETTLPLMRLINMGYGMPMEENWIEFEPVVKQWYSMTQYCEFILPIDFFKDPNLKSNAGVVLKSRKENAGLQGNQYTARSEIPTTKEVKMIRVAGELDTSTELKSLKSTLRSNIKKRARLYRTATKEVIRHMRHNFKQSLKDMVHIGKKNANKISAEEYLDLDPVIAEKSVDEAIQETEQFAENEDDDDSGSRAIARRKRSTGLRRERRDVEYLFGAFYVITIILAIAFLVAAFVFAMIGIYALATHKAHVGFVAGLAIMHG